MKTGLISTIQQTLTQEAASVLNRSIAEAGRRNHGQTTPLHVAATLLDSPTGLLRQACMTSHPNSSHPLQCRALDLCFRVALERLPTAGQKVSDTPLSNALTAALKRAQAHQRRGCPENQQQPLLAIKVELEQLIISILDDPSVSKVMREARFSSPAVKAVIEQSISSQSQSETIFPNSSPIGNRFRPAPFVIGPSPATTARNQNLYISPRLQQRKNSWQSGEHRTDETRNVTEIMMRRKKRNPILVGESEPAAVLKEVLRRIENGEAGEGLLKNAEVIHLENQIPRKINELGGLIESRIGNSNKRGIVLDLGDLKWLVEQPVSEIAKATVAEMGKILSSLVEDDGGGGGIWLIGTASCETYLRCQVYHTSMEKDWDLQAVPITSRSPLSGIIPMSGTNDSIHNPYVNPLISMKTSPPMPLINTRTRCCPICTNNYEQDLAKLMLVSSETKTETKRPPLLPRWLQNAKTDSQQMEDDHSKVFKTESQELHKKWVDTCFLIHPSFHQNPQPRLQTLQLSTNPEAPASPVRTDLVLGREKPNRDCVKDLLGCVSKGEDTTDTFKKLLKGLTEKSWWQKEAASALATAITRTRGCLTKGDVWLLFAGPDKVSKTKMASVLAQQIYGADPITICLGSNRGDNDVRYRGKTSLDRIVEAVRRNPLAVIVLDDIDEADPLLRGSIKGAMEKGRLTDSHGREISLGNIIFIMMVKPDNIEDPNETMYGSVLDSNWRMKVSVQERCSKRRANWLDDDDKEKEEDRTKMQRKGLSLDLNLLLENDYEETQLTTTTMPHELAIHIDDSILFKPVNFGAIRMEIENRIKESFMTIIGKEHTIELEGTAVEKVVGETWLGNLSLEDWIEKVVSPIFEQARSHLSGKTMVVRLMLDDDGSDHGSEKGQVRLVVEGRT
ncbi:protein SUPPRESSOR OF MAX2 1 [Impatiens glandulifera]|uniref:protein SUPPRESSOR OF MAX2 1 n=1 Tax=Impatiens glandulifera TaxID=253017 RepID=UPI001FB063FB|nr:protein SUPPRESSOR OF MAX2 1 [Impatiens glandulifera]